jgi:chaperonin cofactor prefoldin
MNDSENLKRLAELENARDKLASQIKESQKMLQELEKKISELKQSSDRPNKSG